DLFQHIIAFDQFAKSRVLTVKKRRIREANEKLATRGIRMLRARHRNDTAFMLATIKFRFDFVTWIARAPFRFLRGILGLWIAALDHESLDDSMKTGAIVKAFIGKGLKILNRLWRDIWPKLENHFTLVCFNNRNFTGAHNILFLRVISPGWRGQS